MAIKTFWSLQEVQDVSRTCNLCWGEWEEMLVRLFERSPNYWEAVVVCPPCVETMGKVLRETESG